MTKISPILVTIIPLGFVFRSLVQLLHLIMLTRTVAFSSSPWEEPHHCLAPVIKAANFVVSMTGARQGWGSSHRLDEIVVQRDNSCGFFAVPVKIKWTNDRFGLIIWFLGEFACIWWRSMWWFVHLFYRTQVNLGSDLWVRLSVTNWDTLLKLNWCDSGWWRYQVNTNW